jgi:lipopolysaccharide export system protein LptA
MKKINIGLMFIILTAFIPYCIALKSDEKQPLQIDADHATFDQKNMVTVFTGNVIITKGSLKVHANNGVATQDKLGDRTLKLVGAPVTFVQTDDDGIKIEGQANNFDYNTKTSLAVLNGRSRVKKGKNIIIGDSLTYNTGTHIYSASSTQANGVKKQSNGRITVILDNQTNESAPKKK